MVVEGKAGANGVLPGNSLMGDGVDGRPDLQIQATTNLGNGSRAVCDTGAPPAGGGVPAVNPPSFAEGDGLITDALLDFACRFQAFDRNFPCTKLDATGESKFINATTFLQFCNAVATTTAFPPGETVVSVRLRDRSGNVGPTQQIVVRVATPTPRP